MNILVGYVDTPEGRAALERGIQEAKLRDAELFVAHVAKTGLKSDPAEEILAYKGAMDHIEDRLRSEGLKGRAWEVLSVGGKSSALLQVADDVDAGLIVIGLRTRTPVGKLVLGSNSQDIILRAQCPVLSLKP